MEIIKNNIVGIASDIKKRISSIFSDTHRKIEKFEQRIELITTALIFWVVFDTFLKIVLIFVLLVKLS